MGQKNSNPFQEDGEIMSDYTIDKKQQELFITYLTHKKTKIQYLLREQTFNQLREFTLAGDKIKSRKNFNKNPHLTSLERIEDRMQDHMCSNIYKIYSLWEFPNKSLADEINQRALHKKKFENKELWSILACSIMGLAQLQEKDIKHECLTTKAILIANDGNVKIVDPISVGYQQNINIIHSNRNSKNIYLSPEECESIQSQKPISNKNSYKNDVFTLGMILLECGLLQRQDQCYLDDCSKVNYDKIDANLNRFGKYYEEELRQMIELMLRRNIQQRPDWLNLNQFVNQNSKTISKNMTVAEAERIKNQGSSRSQFIKRVANRQQDAVKQTTGQLNNQPQASIFYNPQQRQTINQIPQPQPQPQIQQQSYIKIQNSVPPMNTVQNAYVPSQIVPSQIAQTVYNQPPEMSVRPPQFQANIYQRPPTQYNSFQNIQPVPINFQNNYQTQQTQQTQQIQQIQNNSNYSIPSFQNQFTYPNNKNTVESQNLIPNLPPNFGQDMRVNQPTQETYFQPISQNSYSNSFNFAPLNFQKPTVPKFQQKKQPISNFTTFDPKLALNSELNNSPSNINQYIRPAQSVNYQINKGYSPIDTKFQNKPAFQTYAFDPKLTKTPEMVDSSELDTQPQYVTQNFTIGSKYEGYKLNGMRHGKGKFFYQDGGSYDGQWRQNKMEGFGILYYQSNKKAYEGQWINDQFQGKGKLYNENPIQLYQNFDYENFDEIDEYWQYYEGDFNEDLKDGQGQLKFSNGQYFNGTFKEDMVQGQGIFYCRDGQKVHGIWSQNHLNSCLN